MSEKDGISREFLKDNNRFADAFNFHMYKGVQVIKPEDLEEKDVTEVLKVYQLDEKGNTKGEMMQRWRDLIRLAIIKRYHGIYYVILGLENQSEIHYAMVVRNMIMDALNYGSQVNEAAKRHKADKDTRSSAEFLSGFTKDDKLTPVITLTVYWGAEEWDAPRSLYEMFTDKDREEFALFVSDYKLNLIVPREIEDFGKFSTELGIVLEVIKASNSEAEMGKVIEGNPRYESVRNEVVDVLNTFTSLKLNVDVKEANTNMCKAWEDHKKSGAIEATDRLNKLIAIMLKDGKVEELERSTTDKVLQSKLLDKYVPEELNK